MSDQEKLCSNCRGNPSLPNHWLCFHCLAHFRREHSRRRKNAFGILFICSPLYFFVILLTLGSPLWIQWLVILGCPAFAIYLIFGQKLRLPPPPPKIISASQKHEFCIYCGYPITTGTYCIKCGARIKEE